METKIRDGNTVEGTTPVNTRVNGLYVIYDRMAMDYSNIFEASNHGIAVRHFHAGLRESPYKDDYILYHIGRSVRTDHEIVIIPNGHEAQIDVTANYMEDLDV